MGLILPGERLPSERDISEMMGVSRTTIREAIRVLTVQGALEVRRGRMGGTFVSTQLKRPNAGELRERVSRQGSTLLDVLDLRFVVEQGVAQIAAERATDEQVRELEKFLVDMTGEGRKFPLYRDLDTRFHLLIAGVTQSDRLSSMVADIHAGLSDLMALIPYSEEAVLHSSDQHTRLVAAIKKKKPEQARKIMQEHVSATSSFLRGLL